MIIFPADCCKWLPRESSRILLFRPLCALTRSRCATCLRATNIWGVGRKKKRKYFAFDFFEFCSAVRRRSQNRGRRRAEDGASEGSGSSQSQLGKTGGSSERACVRGRPGAMLFLQRERDAVSAAHLISCKTLCWSLTNFFLVKKFHLFWVEQCHTYYSYSVGVGVVSAVRVAFLLVVF